MQRAVEIRFRDTSTLVREAAVDVIGRFVLCKPELTLQYYDMICERIRVREREGVGMGSDEMLLEMRIS